MSPGVEAMSASYVTAIPHDGATRHGRENADDEDD